MKGLKTSWGFDYNPTDSVNEKVKVVKLTLLKDGSVQTEQFSIPIGELLAPHPKDGVVTVGVPGKLTIARITKLPPIEPKRIPDVVRYEADQLIPFHVDEVEWFYHLIEGEPDTEVCIFAIKKELVEERLKFFEDAEFAWVHQIQPGPVAVFNCLAHHGLIPSTDYTAILNVEQDSIDLIITNGSTFFTRSIPIGVKSVTDAVTKALKITAERFLRFDEAEAGAQKKITEVVLPIFTDISNEVVRTISSFNASHRESKVTKLRLVGTEIPLLSKYFVSPVTYLDQQTGLDPSSSLTLELLETPREIASHCVAHGLALQGLNKTIITGSFLNVKTRSQAIFAGLRKIPLFFVSFIPGLRGLTLIEGLVVVAVIGLLASIMVPIFYVAQKSVAPSNPYALIRIEMFPDGSVKITPEFSPSFNDFGENPLSHTMAKKMLGEER